MTGFYTGSWDNPELEAMGSSLVPSTTGDVLGAVAGSAFASNPTPRLLAAGGDQINQGFAVDEYGRAMDIGTPAPMLDPDAANAQYGIKGALSFDRPVTAQTAQELHDSKRNAILRADVVSRGQGGLLGGAVGQTVTGFAMGLLDPLNLAAGFVPGVGEARIGALLGDSAAGQLGARALSGATAGAAGMAALEPVQALLDSRDHNDWTMSQALRDIAFGGLLGGGLHVLGGAIGDRLGQPSNPVPNPITDRMEAAGYDARDLALRGSVGQLAEGRAVDVQPALDLQDAAAPPPFQPTVRARPDAAPGNYAAYTPGGMRVELRPEIAEAGDLVASHTDDGTVNPDYPHAAGLQPRDRSSIASQAQIAEMASRIEPARLGPSPEAGNGAPIVNDAGVVESGNGRTLALRRMYADPRFADQQTAYRSFLDQSGFDTSGVQQPVLVGRRVTPLDPEGAQAFAKAANERSTLAMTGAEQARADASRAGTAIGSYQPGPLTGPANREFVRGFMAQVPTEERGGMVLGDGRLSGDGERRIRSALMAYSYGDALGPTLERMLNGDVDGMRGIAGALSDVSGSWGALRRAAADGTIPPDLDITPAIGEAVQLLDRARQLGRPVSELLAQTDLTAPPASDAAAALLRLMFTDDAMRRPVSRPKLAELLDRYVQQAMEATPGEDMFGAPPTGPADVLRAIGKGADPFEQAAQAMQDLVGNASRPIEHPDDPPAAATNAEAVQRAPAVPPDVTAALAEAEKGAQDMRARIDTEIKAERLTEADTAELRAADAAAELSEGDAKALEAAATCLAGAA